MDNCPTKIPNNNNNNNNNRAANNQNESLQSLGKGCIKLPPLPVPTADRDQRTPSNTMCLGSPRVSTPNRTSIWPVVLHSTDVLTYRHTIQSTETLCIQHSLKFILVISQASSPLICYTVTDLHAWSVIKKLWNYWNYNKYVIYPLQNSELQS